MAPKEAVACHYSNDVCSALRENFFLSFPFFCGSQNKYVFVCSCRASMSSFPIIKNTHYDILKCLSFLPSAGLFHLLYRILTACSFAQRKTCDAVAGVAFHENAGVGVAFHENALGQYYFTRRTIHQVG